MSTRSETTPAIVSHLEGNALNCWNVEAAAEEFLSAHLGKKGARNAVRAKQHARIAIAAIAQLGELHYSKSSPVWLAISAAMAAVSFGWRAEVERYRFVTEQTQAITRPAMRAKAKAARRLTGSKTREKVRKLIDEMHRRRVPVTLDNLKSETGMSRATIYRHAGAYLKQKRKGGGST
jgi:hypothetical protein